MTESKIYPIVFIFTISLVFVLVLSAINTLAKPRIQEQEKIEFQKSVLYVFGYLEADSALDEAGTKNIYENKITEKTGDTMTVYISRETEKYAFILQSPGLWGTIEALVAVNKDGTRIVGIDFISHSETPGLGGRIDEASFKEQFRNEKISSDPGSRISVVANRDTSSSDDSSVDSITGASRTSEAIQKLINKAVNEILPEVLILAGDNDG